MPHWRVSDVRADKAMKDRLRFHFGDEEARVMTQAIEIEEDVSNEPAAA
jgi:hypothetical protein